MFSNLDLRVILYTLNKINIHIPMHQTYFPAGRKELSIYLLGISKISTFKVAHSTRFNFLDQSPGEYDYSYHVRLFICIYYNQHTFCLFVLRGN